MAHVRIKFWIVAVLEQNELGPIIKAVILHEVLCISFGVCVRCYFKSGSAIRPYGFPEGLTA